MDKALDDITVIDLGQVIAMPFCTMLLADMGANVIKVESREQGQQRMSTAMRRVRNGVEERVPVAQYRDRNKLGITLNLKTGKGVELFKELVQQADVVTENFSVGTMARLGIAYEVLKQLNPRLVYASITAFGQHGPYAEQQGQYIDMALLDSLVVALDNLGERYHYPSQALRDAWSDRFPGTHAR